MHYVKAQRFSLYLIIIPAKQSILYSCYRSALTPHFYLCSMATPAKMCTALPYALRTPVRAPCRPRSKLLMEPVEVFCRIKPPTNDDDEICVRAIDDFSIQFTSPSSRLSADAAVSKEAISRFTFVFDEIATQKMLFDRVAFELVDDLLQGKNGLLFTYGITGSGKTYTMTGIPDDIGILPRCLDVIFNSIVFIPDKTNGFDVQTELQAALEKQREHCQNSNFKPATNAGGVWAQSDSDSEWELCPRSTEPMRVKCIDEDNAYAVFVSYIEIYNNYVYDLLDSSSDRLKAPISKALREDFNRNMYVSSAVEVEVKSTEEAFGVFAKGQRLRRVAHTLLNTESSRSHSVFNIRVVQAPLDESGKEVLQDKNRICVSQLALVDLAGSERTRRTGHVGDRIRETGCINNSLMVLRQCIEQLRNNQKTGMDRLVPYRDSRLTHLFKNYFDGDGKVRMVVCLNPSAADYDENLHVMQFAELTQEVEVPRSMPKEQELDGLTPGRRRAAALMKELSESLEAKTILAGNRFFDTLPSINCIVNTPDEMERILLQLKSHYDMLNQQTFDISARIQKQDLTFKETVTKLAVSNRTMAIQLDEAKRDVHSLEKEKRTLETQLGQAKSHVYNLEYQLNRFERDAKVMINQEELMKRREREMAARERLKDEKLLAVKEIVDHNQYLRPWQQRLTPQKKIKPYGRTGAKRAPSPPPKSWLRTPSTNRRRSKSTDSHARYFRQDADKGRKRNSDDGTSLSEGSDEKRSKQS